MKTFNNQFDIPIPLAVWLASDDYLYAKTSDELSATLVIKSPRYIIATRREMYPEQFPEHLRIMENTPVNLGLFTSTPVLPDIQERIASRIGTAIHDAVEKAWKNQYKTALNLLGFPEETINQIRLNPTTPATLEGNIDIYQENRMYREITVQGKKFTISGQYDMVIDGNLHDIKTTSTYSYETGCNDEKYRLQGSIYRWLRPDLITGDYLTINFVFLDWKNYSAKGMNESYPPAKAYFKKFKLLSLEETESFIKNKLKLLVQHWEDPLEIIPCCSDKELFSKPPVYKYYKDGYVEGKRATRNFNTMAEASKYRAEKGNYKGDIVEYKGDPFTCPYCNLNEISDLSTIVHEPVKIDIG